MNLSPPGGHRGTAGRRLAVNLGVQSKGSKRSKHQRMLQYVKCLAYLSVPWVVVEGVLCSLTMMDVPIDYKDSIENERCTIERQIFSRKG